MGDRFAVCGGWWLGWLASPAPLFVLESGLGREAVGEGLPVGYLTGCAGTTISPRSGPAAELRTSLALLLAVVSLVVRYRRGDELRRRQLLWLVLAAIWS